MRLSDIFYEAACVMSEDFEERIGYSCNAVGHVTGEYYDGAYNQYGKLMRNEYEYVDIYEVEEAAEAVGWGYREYRTFMLLMASEAVK